MPRLTVLDPAIGRNRTNRAQVFLVGDADGGQCSAPGSLDTSLSHAAGLIEIAACHA